MKEQVRSVLIQVDHQEFGSARCSGLQFENVFITHGSLLSFLCINSADPQDDSTNISKEFSSVMKELSKQQYFSYPENYNKIKVGLKYKFKVLLEVKGLSDETYNSEDLILCKLFKYKSKSFHDFLRIIGSSGSLTDNDDSYNFLDLPIFLFLMTGTPKPRVFTESLSLLFTNLNSTPIYRGMSIAVESTPFARLEFSNSLCKGIISKTVGPDEEGLIIDARLVFGCEGAPIYKFEDNVKGVVVGIVVCSLFHCDEEWTGFSFGLNLKHLLMALFRINSTDYIPFERIKLQRPSSFLDIDQLSSSVIFVRCQHKWGSGVVIDADLGLLLTCSHIVHHAQDSVHIIFKGKKYFASVEFASPPSDPYDLAVLKVGKIPGLIQLAMANESPVVGEPVISVGYALSTENSVIADGQPILSGGCISRVSRGGGPLQTTCCTQSGVSGGAVLRPPDQLIGIAVSNVRFGTTLLPFFSFAVSVDDFRIAISQFLNSRDPTCLQLLTVKNPGVKMKWMLQDSKF